jgi:hypothetical protein
LTNKDINITTNQSLTPKYTTTEILGGTFGTGSDIFSMGIIFYELIMLKNDYTFCFSINQKNFLKIIKNDIEVIRGFDSFFTNLIFDMIQPDIDDRISAIDIFDRIINFQKLIE